MDPIILTIVICVVIVLIIVSNYPRKRKKDITHLMNTGNYDISLVGEQEGKNLKGTAGLILEGDSLFHASGNIALDDNRKITSLEGECTLPIGGADISLPKIGKDTDNSGIFRLKNPAGEILLETEITIKKSDSKFSLHFQNSSGTKK